MRRLNYVVGVCSVAVGAFCLTLPSNLAQAEMYVAGQAGATIPQNLSSVEYSVGGVTVGGSNLALHNSVMYGAKAGYYFDSLKWLGLETEIFNTTPNIKQQDVSIGGVNLGTAPGIDLRVLTWAPVNLVVRYQAGSFEPYAGVGLGVFFHRASIQGPGGGSSSGTDMGLNTQLGLRYRVTNNLSLFGEWKFNHANLSQDDFVGATGLKVSADYNAHILAFGVGYHF